MPSIKQAIETIIQNHDDNTYFSDDDDDDISFIVRERSSHVEIHGSIINYSITSIEVLYNHYKVYIRGTMIADGSKTELALRRCFIMPDNAHKTKIEAEYFQNGTVIFISVPLIPCKNTSRSKPKQCDQYNIISSS
jgi:hypothetical protein